MADNTATYIVQFNNGFRVVWASSLEDHLHEKMTKTTQDFIRSIPIFLDYNSAYVFASLVDKANKTARGILLIDKYWDQTIDEIRKN